MESRYCFLFKNIDDRAPIILEQDEAVISNGTTGCHIWPAALQLIEFLDKNKSLIDDK